MMAVSDDTQPLSEHELEAIAAQITRDGRAVADKAIKLGAGSPDIALAILGVAVGRVIDGFDEERRPDMLRDFFESFGATSA